jgi:hypothetical protein
MKEDKDRKEEQIKEKLIIRGRVFKEGSKVGESQRIEEEEEYFEELGRIQKFPDWPPGARTANCTAVCHYVQLYRYFVSQSSKFYRHNTLCCFSTSVYCCKHIFRYRLSPETFGYTLLL